MKIPKTIKIGAYDIAVEPLDHRECISEQSYGMFCMSEGKIKLDFELPSMKVLSTLLHEINHAIFDISATRKLEAWPEEFIVGDARYDDSF